jgi:hypothetical protein
MVPFRDRQFVNGDLSDSAMTRRCCSATIECVVGNLGSANRAWVCLEFRLGQSQIR